MRKDVVTISSIDLMMVPKNLNGDYLQKLNVLNTCESGIPLLLTMVILSLII